MNKISKRERRSCGWVAAAGVALLLCAVPARAQGSANLTLQQAIRLALQNSPDVRLAKAQYQVALGQARVDRASFLPNLYTGTGLAYTYGFPSLPGGQAPAVFELDYQQTIFDPLLRGQQRAAEDRAQSEKIEMDRVHDEIVVRTATDYLNLADVQHSLDLMQTEKTSAERILDIVRERQQANLALPIDVTRAELTVAQINERTVKLQDQEYSLDQTLRQVTGIPADQPIRASTEEPAFAASTDTSGETGETGTFSPATGPAESQMIDRAVQNDRSVKEAENEVDARQEELHGARWSYFPTVAVVGQYSILSKFNNYNEFYKAFERNNVNVGIQVTIPIFAAKTSATVALAKSQLSQADAALTQRRQQVSQQVQKQVNDVRELDASREVARLSLQLAQQNLDIEQARFNDSRATLQEVEQARLDESEKWVAFLDADFAREHAQLVLLQATGELAKVFQ
ncbi:MAG TPA: TolC family protein [Candidatus Dormibacteraeota bacterium]|nr:TolC family protein [Candidatus Dormibacteraeota bacterium]